MHKVTPGNPIRQMLFLVWYFSRLGRPRMRVQLFASLKRMPVIGPCGRHKDKAWKQRGRCEAQGFPDCLEIQMRHGRSAQ